MADSDPAIPLEEPDATPEEVSISESGPAVGPADLAEPAPFPVSKVPELDAGATERALLASILPGSEVKGMAGTARRLMQGKSALGRFAAGRMLEKANVRESELLHHRAKVAFVDAAAITVPMFFNELGRTKPNPVVLAGCQWAISKSGIAVDSVPISQEQRTVQMAEDRELANLSPAELKARISERVQNMKLGAGGGK